MVILLVDYINNSLHLARKYARIFVRGHYLFRKAHVFPRAKLEENCEVRGTDNVRGQIPEHIFAAKLRLLCLLSIGFKRILMPFRQLKYVRGNRLLYMIKLVACKARKYKNILCRTM